MIHSAKLFLLTELSSVVQFKMFNCLERRKKFETKTLFKNADVDVLM